MTSIVTEEAEPARLVLYRVLSLVFYEPSPSLVEMIEDRASGAELVQAADSVLGAGGAQEARALLDSFLKAEGSREQVMLDLRVEYNRLFVGPAAPPCPPYQSVHDTSRPNMERGTVLGPTAEAVQAAMQREGLGVVLDHAELPDHAALVLELMYYLLARTQDVAIGPEYAVRAGEFRANHIVPWLGKFGTKVAGQAREPFYSHAGRLLALFVASEAKL